MDLLDSILTKIDNLCREKSLTKFKLCRMYVNLFCAYTFNRKRTNCFVSSFRGQKYKQIGY